jgi:hypothetical protein
VIACSRGHQETTLDMAAAPGEVLGQIDSALLRCRNNFA